MNKRRNLVMKTGLLKITGMALVTFLLFFKMTVSAGDQDPWDVLRQKFETPPDSQPVSEKTEKYDESTDDPWKQLQAIYLPFTEEEETAAVTDKVAGRKVASGFHSKLDVFVPFIREASERFHVPVEIISGVIMVESGGDSNARAKTSSAAGLMQTIAGTYTDARSALARQGIRIASTPLDPRSSILAGTWYLDQMYKMAAADRPGALPGRDRIDSWKYPLEYYYAGPGNGVKRDPVVIIYSGGRKVVVDKPKYSGKVLKWAKILKAA